MATKTDYDRLSSDLADIGRPIVVGFEATGTLANLAYNFDRLIFHQRCEATG